MNAIIDNLGNIAAVSLLAAAAGAVIAVMIIRRRKGRPSCGCDCAFCQKPCDKRK